VDAAGAGQLPAGMSMRDIKRHAAPHRPRGSDWTGFAMLASLAIVGTSTGNLAWGAPCGLLALLSLAILLQRPGVPITEESQPQLWAAVMRVADRVAVPAPRRVWLTHLPEVTVHARRWRYDVWIGLPVLAVLGEHEIRGLLAHQLAQCGFPRPDLVVPLAQRWREVAAARSDDDAPPDDRETEQALRNAAVEVERVADRAAVEAAGTPRAAARAIAVVDSLEWELYDFLDDLRLPPRTGWPRGRAAIEDINEVWRRAVRDGREPWLWDSDDGVELAHRHPDLADAILVLDEADLTLRPPETPVVLQALTRRERRRIARRWLGLWTLTPIRWRTVATAPSQWWAARARRSTEGIRARVTELLGRDPVDHAELADVVLRRNDELMALLSPAYGARGGATSDGEDTNDGDTNGDGATAQESAASDGEPVRLPPVLLAVLEDALTPLGWRLEHPIVRGVLIGPRGQRIDGRTLTEDTYVATLRALTGRGAATR
jgi:hypothetical protein